MTEIRKLDQKMIETEAFALVTIYDDKSCKETQKAAYEEQCEQGFVHQEQSNEDYFESLNDYFDGTMSI